jgi:hypothetical protein
MILNAKRSNFIIEQTGKRPRSDSDEFNTKYQDYNKPGCDNRNNETNDTDDLEILYNIHNYYHKYQLLKYLQNNNITNQSKLESIEKNNIFSNTYQFNPLTGGLFDDWNRIF